MLSRVPDEPPGRREARPEDKLSETWDPGAASDNARDAALGPARACA
jgi:hypothetical protein